MVDVLIIAVVVGAVALAARSIIKSFFAGRCGGCSSSHACAGSGASCPAAQKTLSDMEARLHIAHNGADR